MVEAFLVIAAVTLFHPQPEKFMEVRDGTGMVVHLVARSETHSIIRLCGEERMFMIANERLGPTGLDCGSEPNPG